MSKFESLHPRPCGVGDIDQYVRDILPYIQEAMKLTQVAMKYAVPHVARMIHLRLHSLLVGGDVLCKELWACNTPSSLPFAGRGDGWYHRVNEEGEG